MTTTINSLLQTNTYQVVMSSDGKLSFVTFLFDDIQWTNSDGQLGILGGGSLYLPIIIVRASQVRILPTTSNVGVPAWYVYVQGGLFNYAALTALAPL